MDALSQGNRNRALLLTPWKNRSQKIYPVKFSWRSAHFHRPATQNMKHPRLFIALGETHTHPAGRREIPRAPFLFFAVKLGLHGIGAGDGEPLLPCFDLHLEAFGALNLIGTHIVAVLCR